MYTQKHKEFPKLVGYAEAAALLGIARSTLYCHVCRKQLPFIRLNRRHVKFDVDELRGWIDAHGVSPEDNGSTVGGV